MTRELYTFAALSKKLDELGYPPRAVQSGFKVIRTDFVRALQGDKITFGPDGIYLEHEGISYRGYAFIKEPYISDYNSYPKFHLTRCITLDQFIAEGNFRKRYEWSNNRTNDLIDFNTRVIYQDVVLDYCQNCRRLLLRSISDTEDFYNSLEEHQQNTAVTEIDIFGYSRDWAKISKAVRQHASYTCSKCSIQITNPLHHRFLHVHHINGNKADNNLPNLQCLCVLCHLSINTQHDANLSSPQNIIQVVSFIKLYRSQLKTHAPGLMSNFIVNHRQHFNDQDL